MENFFRKPIQRQKQDRCEIIIKKGKDGSIKKTARGCTPQELRALTRNENMEVESERD